MNNIIYRWSTSIDEISESSWNAIFKNNITKEYNFFKAMHFAEIKDCSFLYLVISCQNRILSIIPCFIYKLDVVILAPKVLKRIVAIIRRVFKNLFKVNIFGVGSLASTCEHHIGIADDLTDKEKDIVVSIINTQIKSKSKKLGNKLVLIKEVPEGQLLEIKQIFSNDFHFYYSLPHNIFPVFKECTPYPSGLRRKERQRYNKFKKKFDENFYWEKAEDFSQYLDVFEKMYLDSLDRSNNKFEILNKNFFGLLNSYYPKHSYLFVIRRKIDNRIEALGLTLEDSNSLIPIYLGLNYDNSKDTLKILHTNSITKVVLHSEIKNKTIVKAGQTSYYSKILSGALVENLYIGLFSYNSLMQFLIKTVFFKLFKPTKVMNNVYNDNIKDIIKDKCTDIGLKIIN